jgi:spore coat protein CotH
MSKNTLYQGTSILLAVLLLVLFPVSLAGCRGQSSAEVEAGDSAPFYSDRVVTVRIVMSAEDWEFTQKNARAEEYVKADMWYDGELVPDIAVRPKGNSSLMTASSSGTSRLPLKVDLNFFNSARNLYGVKKLNFNNGFSDPSFIREVLAYELFEQMDIPTPRTSFVDLWVNDTHLGLYTMVEQIDKTFLENNFADSTGNLYKPEMPAAYLNWTVEDLDDMEVVSSAGETSEAEVNLGGGNLAQIMQALEPKSSVGEAETSSGIAQDMAPPQGLLLGEDVQLPEGIVPPQGMFPGEGMQPSEGMAPPRGVFPGEGVQPSEDMVKRWEGFQREGMRPPGDMPGMFGNQSGNLLKQMGLKTNENKPDHSLLLRFLDILNNEPDETFPGEIEKVLDVNETLRFLAVSALIVHLDNYIGMGHNYYLYENDGKFVVIPWDLNMAFGAFNSGLQRDGLINFYIDEPTAGAVAQRPLVERLLSYQPYLDTYHKYLQELLDGPFAIEAMNSRIDEVAALVRPYVEADELKFYSTEQFEAGLAEGISQAGEGVSRVGGGGFSSSIGLKAFVAERSASVLEQLAGTRKSSSGDGSGNGGSGGMGQMGDNRMPRQRE